MQFNGFPKEAIVFLKNLREHNDKVWFEHNRHVWEAYIHQPNIHFIQEMGETLQILVPTIHAKPKVSGSLFKIYRDTRFSKDKTPMKSNIGLLFWQGSAHRMQSSSFYMHYDPQEVFVATGIRNFKPTLLKTYREYIQNEERRTELHAILEDLKSKGYMLPEPRYKRMPRECKAEDANSYLYLMGAIYAYTTFPPDVTFHSEAIIEKNFNIYEDMFALQQWLYELTLHCDTEADVYR